MEFVLILLLMVLLLLLKGFFSGSETALMTLNRYRMKSLARKGHRGAKLARYLLQRPDRLLGLILLGNNLVNILAASLATALFTRAFGESGVALATLVPMAYLLFSQTQTTGSL